MDLKNLDLGIDRLLSIIFSQDICFLLQDFFSVPYMWLFFN